MVGLNALVSFVSAEVGLEDGELLLQGRSLGDVATLEVLVDGVPAISDLVAEDLLEIGTRQDQTGVLDQLTDHGTGPGDGWGRGLGIDDSGEGGAQHVHRALIPSFHGSGQVCSQPILERPGSARLTQ